MKEIRQVFGFTFRVFYFAENVASVDGEAEQQVRTALGTRLCRVDCADAAPIHRLAFVGPMSKSAPLLMLRVKLHWMEAHLAYVYPNEDQRLEEGAVWEGAVILPARVKSICQELVHLLFQRVFFGSMNKLDCVGLLIAIDFLLLSVL